MDEQTLKNELISTLDHIVHGLQRLEATAAEVGCPLMDLRDKMGRYMAHDLLIAKAETLAALVRLTK